ncbi:hypothetical protein EC973_001074 [Apophysomyces ossiformis]|uniref:Peptidase A1 domain-containing protein n=1 Tax=Apophysomyces ossiformis TaxID=679940 RepID=A0A8H7ENG7_9FUNG|nr:hypothetical protein EC973_001074 [Apophysomyces ossiformis]
MTDSNLPGKGPDALSAYNNDEGVVMPTVVTTMYQSRIIDHNVFSVYFQPLDYSSQLNRINGEVIFGGVNMSYVEGDVSYAPISTNQDFLDYWSVDIDRIEAGNRTFQYTKKLVALTDTGSTLLFLPSEAVNAVFENVTGAWRDYYGQYVVPCDSKDLGSVKLTMGGIDYELSPEDYVISAGPLNGPSKGYCYTYLMDAPDYVDAILGYGFLQHFVSVYDAENRRIGFGRRKELNKLQ